MTANENGAPQSGALLGQLVPVPEEQLGGGSPVIQVNDRQLNELSEDALEAIRQANDPPRILQRGGVLVRLRHGPGDGIPVLEPLNVDSLRGVLARSATWVEVKTGKHGTLHKGVSPPLDVVRDLLALPAYPESVTPRLDGIVECPTFVADGSLVSRPGYDPDARLWYSPAPGLDVKNVPLSPDRATVRLARLRLWDLIGDFPFADGASRANAMALLLLPFLRPMIDGPTPLHLIEAAKAGTGKGLLADVVHFVATGRTTTPTAEVGEGDEWRKRLFAALLADPRFVLIDNIYGYLDSGALASTLTARTITDRVLGSSRTAEAPVRCVWVATGNNVRMSTELARRTPLIRLVATEDHPWRRPYPSFRHPDLIGFTSRNRGILIRSALILCRAWIAAGQPEGEVSVGSFESWSRAMSGLMEVIGVGDFMKNADQLLDHGNDEQAKWGAMTRLWWEKFRDRPVGTADLYPMVKDGGLLENILGDGNDQSRLTRLGRALGRQRDASYDGRRIVTAGDAHNGAKRYRLVSQAGG